VIEMKKPKQTARGRIVGYTPIDGKKSEFQIRFDSYVWATAPKGFTVEDGDTIEVEVALTIVKKIRSDPGRDERGWGGN
jgi:hypothetical protein